MLSPYLLVVGFSLTAANPILQRIPLQIPAQYSAPCPTSPTQTCPTQTCPTSRPPCQSCQTPYRTPYNPQPIGVQSSNNCPCNKPVTAQTPVANPLGQDALSQMVLRRLLNPPPPPVNPAPDIPCNYCETQKAPPNIINNYIIIPPEFFKNQTTVAKDEAGKRKKGKRRKQSRQRSQQSECPCKDVIEDYNGKSMVKEEVKPCPGDKENISETVRKAEIQNGKIEYASSPNAKAVKEKGLPRSDHSSKNISTPQNNTELSSKLSQIENINTIKPKKGYRERTRSIEEAIIKDFCKKHPTVPEEIARSLLRKLKHQIDVRDHSYYNPYPLPPHGYGYYGPEMFYQRNDDYTRAYSERLETDRRSRKRKPHRSGRRNKKHKEELKENTDTCDKSCEKIVEKQPTLINIETERITTEKITTTTENNFKEKLPINDSETQMETPDDLLKQLEQMKEKFAKLNEIETTTVSYNKRIEQYPELGKEDKVPTLYDNGVDEYYPDFRGDNAYYASGEECESKEHNQYETSSETLGSKRYVNFEKPVLDNKSHKYETSTEYPISASTESYDSYEEPKYESEILRFIVPPHLELPDFETRQVNAQTHDKSVADPRPEIEMKPAKVFTKDKSGRTNIETVYGHSRVIKYGHDAQGAASEPVITYYLPEEAISEDRIHLPDGERIVVIAKSIRDLEDDWE